MKLHPAWALAVVVIVGGVAAWLALREGDLTVEPPREPVTVTAPAAPPQPAEAQPVERTPAPTGVAGPALMIEVRVVDAESGAPVPGAGVWHVAPDFTPGQLTAAHQELYSRAIAAYMQQAGRSVPCDAAGRARIPRAAAMHVVLARHGARRGTNSLRDDGDVLEIRVSPHFEIVVETVDRFGAAVPHVQVDAVRVTNGMPNLMSRWKIGTTDDRGLLAYCAKAADTVGPPGAAGSAKLWFYARSMGTDHGPGVLDLADPPAAPIRLTVPATGRVRVRLVGESGAWLDPSALRAVRAEISASPGEAISKRLYRHLDDEGWAEFGVELERDLFLRFLPLVDVAVPFAGPRSAGAVVTVVHALKPGHPVVAGVLVGPDREPIGDAEFSLLVQKGEGILCTCGGRTARDGTFVIWLPAGVTGVASATLRIGMDWTGREASREATATPGVPLRGRVELGTVVMPAKR